MLEIINSTGEPTSTLPSTHCCPAPYTQPGWCHRTPGVQDPKGSPRSLMVTSCGHGTLGRQSVVTQMEKLLALTWSSPGSTVYLLTMTAWQPTFAAVFFGARIVEVSTSIFLQHPQLERVQLKSQSTESSTNKCWRGTSPGVVCMPGPTLLAAKKGLAKRSHGHNLLTKGKQDKQTGSTWGKGLETSAQPSDSSQQTDRGWRQGLNPVAEECGSFPLRSPSWHRIPTQDAAYIM